MQPMKFRTLTLNYQVTLSGGVVANTESNLLNSCIYYKLFTLERFLCLLNNDNIILEAFFLQVLPLFFIFGTKVHSDSR